MGVWFDMEDADGYKRCHYVTDRGTLTDMCVAFASVCEIRGYNCGVYASLDWLENKLNSKYQYLGDYMNQYSWPETVHAELDEISYSLYDD